MAWWGYLILIVVGGVAWYFITRRRKDYVDREGLTKINKAAEKKTKTVEAETAAKLAKASSAVGADLKAIETEHTKKLKAIERDKNDALDTLRNDPAALDSKLAELLGRKT